MSPSSVEKIQLTVVGSGAMACLLGARLSFAAEVTLADSWKEGIEAIRAGGITVDDSPEPGVVQVAAELWEEAIPPADLVLILVKAWQTEAVSLRLERWLKPHGVALTLQNGLGNLERLGPRACLGVCSLAPACHRPAAIRRPQPRPARALVELDAVTAHISP